MKDDPFAGFPDQSWLEEEEAGGQGEEERVYPQEDLAAAHPPTQTRVSKRSDIPS